MVRDLSSRDLKYEQHMMPTERLLDNSLSWLFGYVGYWNGRDDEHPDGGGAEGSPSTRDSTNP